MTLPNLGFHGTSSAGTGGLNAYQSLSGLIHDWVPGKFRNTINQNSPTIGTKGLIERVPAKGGELKINVMAGAAPSTTYIKDFDPLPRKTSLVPAVGRVQPSSIITILGMGREAWDTVIDDGDATISLFKATLDMYAEDCARHVGRAIFNGSVSPQAGATWSGTAANSTVTVPFSDISMFKVNMAVDFIDTSTTRSQKVRVQNVTSVARGTGSAFIAGDVTFINDVINSDNTITALTDTAVATGDFFKLRGTTAGDGSVGSATTVTGNPLTSFDDIAGSGADLALHGINPAQTPGWNGNFLSVSTTFNQEAVLQFMMLNFQKGGNYPTHFIMSPQMAGALAASAASSARPMKLDSSYDKYGNLLEDGGLRLAGKTVIVDPNCPADTIVSLDNKSVKLAVWKEMGPEMEGDNKVFVDRDTYSYSSQISGRMQLFCTNRKSIGVMRGFTSL